LTHQAVANGFLLSFIHGKSETPPSPAFLWLAHNSFVESRIVKTLTKELNQHDEIELQNHRHYLARTRPAFD